MVNHSDTSVINKVIPEEWFDIQQGKNQVSVRNLQKINFKAHIESDTKNDDSSSDSVELKGGVKW